MLLAQHNYAHISSLTPLPPRIVATERINAMPVSQDLLDILACPQCKGPVNYLPAAREIHCAACRLAYPVRDDIPVMLIDEALSIAARAGVVDKA